jgi:phosphoserine phosphatase RsbX
VTETLPGVLEWGVATLAIEGEEESGDLYVVKPTDRGALVVAIDGLGHGPEAAIAARAAAEICSEGDFHDLPGVFDACHEGLKRTRGVVMSAALIDAERHRMEWMGVGNIEATLMHADGGRHETIMLFGGVAGHQLPRLRSSATALLPGDLLLFATDGLGRGYASDIDVMRPTQEIADEVLQRHNKGSDDALVLAARYVPAG